MKFRNFSIKDFLWFSLLSTFLLLGRISLLNKGFFNDTDELPVLVLIQKFESFTSLSLEEGIKFSLHTDHPLLAVFIRHFQISILKINSNFSTEFLCSDKGAFFLGLFNVLFATIASYSFFKVLRNLGCSLQSALLGVLILASLVNSNLYLRHIISYDASLCFYMLALALFTKDRSSWKRLLYIGFFLALGFFTYYGYFIFPLGLALYLFIETKGKLWIKLRAVLILALPSLFFLFIIESTARFYQESFIEHNLLFSQSIVQGSSEEVFAFIFKYLIQVEGLFGVFIIIGFVASILLSAKNYFRDRQLSKHVLLSSIGIFMYLLYASYAYLSGSMVFYGRLLHLYFPFMLILIVPYLAKHKVFYVVIFLAAFFNFTFNISNLNKVDYPRSISYNLGLFKKNNNDLRYFSESNPGLTWDGTISEFMPISKDLKTIEGSYDLVNFCFFYHYPDSAIGQYTPYEKLMGNGDILEWNHFMSFPAYTFEYCTPQGRKYFMEKKFKIGLFQTF
ncbi:MAG: glycosyltransferase family 39 protein [Chitinophagales bacterium]|nr:glycosyltransferase family 39 protein [Chitinophagales bacterium]